MFGGCLPCNHGPQGYGKLLPVRFPFLRFRRLWMNMLSLPFFVRLWWTTDFPPVVLFSTSTTLWAIGRANGLLRMSCSVPQHPHKQIMGPRGLMGGQQFSASACVEVPGEISLIWLFVASSVWEISRAVSSVRVASLSRSFVCVHLELDPKIRASMMCSSGFVNRHSSTGIRIFLTNESTDSPGCCFRVPSLYLDSWKMLFGDKKLSKRVQ